MTVHTGVDPRTLARLAADVGQLVDPIHVAVTQQRRRPDGRRETRAVVITHPPLLAQLRAACEPGATFRSDPVRRSAARSRPAANPDAIDALGRIHAEMLTWMARAGAVPGRRPPAELDPWRPILRALVGTAPNLAPSLALELADDVRRWWRSAARHSGWRPEHLEALR